MSKRIKILSELVINQIAAGEVIERPASVLKELLENSIDAKSSMIKIYIENGGISLIKVVDNGCGIHPDDLELAFIQHATSKIIDTEDLTSITSLGFRGEALASIASVSKINIISRQTIPSGTTIEVRDLFYNLPVRKKFLRSSTTEYNYLQEMFKRIALSNFNVGFMFYHNHKLIKNLPAINCSNITDNLDHKEQRISKLIGSKFIADAIFFNSEITNMQLCGWVSKGSDVSGSHIQYIYINNRAVKDKLLNMAVKQALGASFIVPAYCLYLYLNPKFLDVNVHPTKQEVRFSDPKMVYAFVGESILEAVKKFQVSELNQVNKVDTYGNSNTINNRENLIDYLDNNQFTQKDHQKATDPNLELNTIKSNNIIDNNYDDKLDKSYNKINKNKWQDVLVEAFNYKNTFVNSRIFEKTDNTSIHVNNYKIITIFNNKYLIFESTNNGEQCQQVIFLDVVSSVKWLIKHKLNQIEGSTKPCNLIIPERVKCNNLDLEDLNYRLQLLSELKFEVSQIHDCVLIIRAIPDCLNLFEIKVNYANFFKAFMEFKDLVKLEKNVLKEKIINLLALNLELPGLNLYTKKDLIDLIEELNKADFKFFSLAEKEFEKILE